MPVTLTPEERSEIFLTIKKAFSDFKYFDKVEGPLLQVIHDATTKYDLDYDKTKNILDYIPDRDQYKTKEQSDILSKFRVILTAATILIYSYHPDADAVRYPSIEVFLQYYPEYDSLRNSTVLDDRKELEYLLNFRNYMAIALLIITAKSNKLFLLKVIERLEGSNNEYITGSGQKPSTTRRLDIYKREGLENSSAKLNSSSKGKPPLAKASHPVHPSLTSTIPHLSTTNTIPNTTTIFNAQKKRKVDQLNDHTLPMKSEFQPSNSQQSNFSNFSLPSTQEDDFTSFVRSNTYRVIQGSHDNDEDDRNAAVLSTPSMSRANSLLRYASEVDELFKVDTVTEEALLKEEYKGSFSATIQKELGKNR